MTDRLATRALWVLAAVAVAAGGIMTARTLAGARAVTANLDRKLGETQRLRSLEFEAARFRAARLAFDQLPRKQAANLAPLLKEFFPDVDVQQRDERKEIGEGWVLRHKELTLSGVPLKKTMDGAMAFVRKAEAQRPPWRLTKCEVKASSSSEGAGDIALGLDAVEEQK
jgi:hypothetical protein